MKYTWSIYLIVIGAISVYLSWGNIDLFEIGGFIFIIAGIYLLIIEYMPLYKDYIHIILIMGSIFIIGYIIFIGPQNPQFLLSP